MVKRFGINHRRVRPKGSKAQTYRPSSPDREAIDRSLIRCHSTRRFPLTRKRDGEKSLY
jgi:hypothetical protein